MDMLHGLVIVLHFIGWAIVLGGAAGVSLCGIVLEWRIAAHGTTLALGQSNPQRIAAFGETFIMLATLCLIAMVAARQLQEKPATSPKSTK